jgi:CTP synthase
MRSLLNLWGFLFDLFCFFSYYGSDMNKKPQFIFVTGGVCSSLGKGIVASSVASILKSAGVKVAVMKLDPYLNVDPGTMSPFQHGEVFILDDGAETDLDLGHYERFVDTPLNKYCSVTTGRVYSEVLAEEREGKYLGGTIQVVPHITGKIREKIELATEKAGAEVMVIEIGGTVGDIEGEPFLEVLRQMRHDKGRNNVLSLHVTLLPYLAAAGELKTKPTQLSVRELRSKGINPDLIFTRADMDIPQALMDKIAYFCDVDNDCVIPAETVKSIYEVPLKFEERGLGKILSRKLGLGDLQFDLSEFREGMAKLKSLSKTIEIGLAGKYNELDDAYLSVIEAIKSAGVYHGYKTKTVWIDTEKIESDDEEEWAKVKSVAGIIVPGGFGNRGIEGKIKVAHYCRKNNVAYLGLCLGSQIMAIEFARNVLNLADATSEEFDEDGLSANHVVHFMEEQRAILKKGGTMRLGSYPCAVKPGTKAHAAYGKDEVDERHRHRFEFNNAYRENFEANGFLISGTSPDGSLVEIVELAEHPFMVGSQFHPELISRPWRPHPLFRDFLGAAAEK